MYYWEYIRVEELLRLLGGVEGEEKSNDETLFIVVHQIYELWFKLILRELTTARDLFNQNPVPDMAMANAVRSLRRVVTIVEQAVNHFRVMETLTTRDYLEFRDRLIPASGFQSAQMREIEILLGLEDSARLTTGCPGAFKDALKYKDGTASPALDRVEARVQQGPSIKTVLYDWLERTPVGDGADGVERFIDSYVTAHRAEVGRRVEIARTQGELSEPDLKDLRERYDAEAASSEKFLRGLDEDGDEATIGRRRRVRAALVFLESYRELPRLAWPREVIDAILSVEQVMIIWRQRHARMVERVIGRRVGTGGSSGVDYLDQTALRYRIFGDIWSVRTLLLRKPSVPSLPNDEDDRFRIED